ncbi:MFS transporter [Pseudoduganella sp. LjRoot289]|uniref:MFS transporter n=1 Tax=Pseudoduganella sp. LjRoot289 TaxID=3342314 RepID=UPI003ECFED67
MFTSDRAPSLKTVLLASGVVLILALGVRHGFGFWMQPISQANGWTRETFSLALALQNLMWGVFGPFAGMAADRFGTMRVVLAGALSYTAGLVWMAVVTQPALFIVGSGVFIGLGLACTGFGAVSGIIGRVAPVERRSWAFGISGATSSFGQFMMMPLEQFMISSVGWENAFYLLAGAIMVAMVPMSFFLREPPVSHGEGQHQSIGDALGEALRNRSFLFLVAGYFVCGFQVVFIAVHLPAYLKDKGMGDPRIAVMALALIGLFNIFGSYFAGKWGGMVPKRYLLSGIYFIRSLVIGLFLLAPLSAVSVYVFAAAMGFIWLSTVPLTNGVIAGIFGVKHMSMLAGVVFLSHQIGSFLGVWLGGYLFALKGNYDVVWGLAIALGVMAGLANLPVDERPVARGALKPA